MSQKEGNEFPVKLKCDEDRKVLVEDTTLQKVSRDNFHQLCDMSQKSAGNDWHNMSISSIF